MSATTVKMEFTPAAQAVLAKFTTLPQRVLVAIARGLDDANQLTVGVIMHDFLSFPKDSPPTLEGLRAQSNRLRGSVRASKAVISGDAVTASIGSNVKYAPIHEYGGTFKRVLLAGSVRLTTDRAGNLLRQGKNGKLAIFARNRRKQAVTVAYAGGKSFDVTYPARRPFARGVEKNKDAMIELVSQRIVEAARA